jgi:hypothetical protein
MKQTSVVALLMLMGVSLVRGEPEMPWRVATAWYATAAATDYYTTERALDTGQFYETNPVFPDYPTDSRFFAQAIALDAGVWMLARQVRKSRPRLALWILIGGGLVHGIAAARNDRLTNE